MINLLTMPDRLLQRATMYRVVLYGLILLVISSFISAAFSLLGFSLLALSASLLTTLLAAGFAHFILRKIFHVSTAYESWLISSLIIFLIIRPDISIAGLSIIAIASVIAIASKYVVTYHEHHIVNPVAFALVILGLLGSSEVYWWIGAQSLLPVVIIVGLTVLRKTRRLAMCLIFIATVVAVSLILSNGLPASQVLRAIFLSGPLVFFATIMFVEPLTSPQTSKWRVVYAVIVGIFFAVPLQIGVFHSSPELALMIGNLLVFAILRPQRVKLKLKSFAPEGSGVYEFVFAPSRRLRFKPGQYIEITIPHNGTDSRGNRRFFSIASGPSEDSVKLAIRVDPDHNSSFKRAMMGLKVNDEVWGAAISGDFVLPNDTSKKLLFIAGGVGITPFRSMLSNIIAVGQKRDINIIYTASKPTAFSYFHLIEESRSFGVTCHYVLTGDKLPGSWNGLTGKLDAAMLSKLVPDFKQRITYAAGPPAMVSSNVKMLRKYRVMPWKIKTDFFSGY